MLKKILQQQYQELELRGISRLLLGCPFTAIVYYDQVYGTIEIMYCLRKIQAFLLHPTDEYAEFKDYTLSEIIDILHVFQRFLVELLAIPEEYRQNG